MSDAPELEPTPEDHGKVVRKGGSISWAWLFPVVALAAAAWMYASHIASLGPEIEIRFTDAPGVEAGKTPLIFRGVVSGMVMKVNLDRALNEAVVTVRLEKFASGLAVDTTEFWIERPEITLQGATGLTSLISGNTIRATQGTGPRRYEFEGLASGPVLAHDETAFNLRLESEQTQSLDRGAPVTFRGVRVGRVREQSLTPEGKPYIDIAIEDSKRELITTASRFWTVPASSVTMGPGGIKVDVAGLETIIQGAIAFDNFGMEGTPLEHGSRVPLLESEALAKACGEPITIVFPNGRGLRAGQTRLTHHGVPVGMVSDVKVVAGQVHVTARFNPGFDFLRSSGSRFLLVEPQISLQGISGLETLITGVVIECEPGHGAELETHFIGMAPKTDDSMVALASEEVFFRLRLESKHTHSLRVGAPVMFRGVKVGRVREQSLTPEGKPFIELAIHMENRDLLKTSSRFWAVSASSLTMGPGGIRLDVSGLDTLIQGAVAFDDFGMTGKPLTGGATLPLFDSEAMALACGPPFKITFPNGRGLTAEQTRLTYMGVPVGMVTGIKPVGGQVEVTARLNPGYEFLRAEGSRFTLIKPEISLEGISGLETLITGVVIDCTPGRGTGLQTRFTGIGLRQPGRLVERSESGRKFRLISRSTATAQGAPVLFREMPVGAVLERVLTEDSRAVEVVIGIEEQYAHLVRENSVFWDERGLRGSIGFFDIRIRTAIPLPGAGGGAIAFGTPDDSAPIAPAGSVFTLHERPQRQWRRWNDPAFR